VITEQKSDTDIYDGEVEDISVYEYDSDTSMPEAEIKETHIQIILSKCRSTMGGRENFRSTTQLKTYKVHINYL
jgi:hypothetical protein